MCTAIDRLRSLKVTDVMTRGAVELSVGQGMDEAAEVFATHGISTAPVTNEFGCCIGILSTSDFLHRECSSGDREFGTHALVDGDHCTPLKIAPTCDSVGTYMTDAVQSIAVDQSLLNAAHIMCVGHVHHLPVFDGECLVGMLSVMDVVAAMMNAFDEMAVDTLKKEGG